MDYKDKVKRRARRVWESETPGELPLKGMRVESFTGTMVTFRYSERYKAAAKVWRDKLGRIYARLERGGS